VVLALALINHLWGAKRTGSGLGAVDHIHYAPVLSSLYDRAEKRAFDAYEIGLQAADMVAKLAWVVDRGIDFVYDVVTVRLTLAFTTVIRTAHTGSYVMYLAWALVGLAGILALLLGVI